MNRRPKVINPFFLLLGVVGAIFAVSALLYGIMVVRFSHTAGGWAADDATHPLIGFFSEYGGAVLGWELAALAVLAVAAVWSDDYWARRAHDRSP